MKILILKNIDHRGMTLLAGTYCMLEDHIARGYVRKGLALDVNHVMNEPQTKQAAEPEGTGENPETKKDKKTKNKGG